MFRLAKLNAPDDHALKQLFVLVGDREAVAAIDRKIMGQGEQVEVVR